MTWLVVTGIVLILLGVLFPTARFTLRKKDYRNKLIQDVALGLFYLLCGLVLFFQSWRFEPSGMETFVIIVLALTNVCWVATDVRRN